MSKRKRKSYSKDLQCVLFPDDAGNAVHNVMRRESASLTSSAKSWEKCGDSFQDSSMRKNLKSSGRSLSAVRKLVPSLLQNDAAVGQEEALNIAWSSSDSEQSDKEIQKKNPTTVDPRPHRGCRRATRPCAPVQGHSKGLITFSTEEDDLQLIDSGSDQDSEEEVEKDSGQQISDCESETFDGQKDSLPNPPNVEKADISGYSDGENAADSVTSSRMDSQYSALQTAEGSRRSVSDWVRSAQAMLQTPQKPIDRQSKTPEDSAKKKRKFQRGGLAERLNQLQRRQRSAVSFWRHQSISDTSTTTTTVDRPGVLVLEVLELQRECGMTLALCDRQPQGDGHQRSPPDREEKARVLVLFSRETAAQLVPAPKDIVHIHPPWQSLSIHGFSYEVILNTHFSQKVFSGPRPVDTSVPRILLSAGKCRPCNLAKVFGLLENTEVTVPSTVSSFGRWGDLTAPSLSLLDAIEALGQAGSVGQDIEVMVQRVFSEPVPDFPASSLLKPRVPSRTSSAPPPAEKGKTRLCVLIQDSCGTFSLVQLHLLPSKDDVHHYCRKWQGKACVLRGVKVVQRLTREKRSRLFSLIDSLWPPLPPPTDDGNTTSTSTESRSAGPAPSFCYLLSGQESSVQPAEGHCASALYFPPARQTLRDILQGGLKHGRCSFAATLIHKRVQSFGVGRDELWLVLTDHSLQEERPDAAPCRRTLTLCVSTSCVLTSCVLEALHSPAACHMTFTDVIQEHGVLLCAEQSVVELCPAESTSGPEKPSRQLTEPQAKKPLTRPVKLDPLSLEATPNSLCTLTGVIVGVDEDTAYSWPACNLCGSDDLEMSAERRSFYCVSCKSAVDKPDTKVQLEVFLSSSLSNCTLKVKLRKQTVMSVLNTAALEGDQFPGYDVENVLGKEVGPLAVYVRVVTRKPAPWMGLEEICL